MAFDQNQILKDLRPLNIARTVGDETRIAPSASRNVETFFPNPPSLDAGSPGSGTVFYPATVSDGGFVGLGYPNAIAGVASPWCPQVPVAIGPQGTAVGFNYAQNLGNWVAGNAGDQASNDMAAGLVYTPNLNSRAGGSTADQSSNNSATGLGCSPNVRSQVGGNGIDQANEEGGDDSMSGKKVKFLCSFGGKILPRPSDGMLRYVGGQTRIISVRKDVNFSELIQKMTDTCGQPVVIKYQLPDEDLDALVSVSCADDLENMMDEYAKLVERSPDGSAKLRVFLFSASELDSPGGVQFADFQDGGQKYVEAVNGVMDGGVSGGIMRKESITSATSTQNSDFSVTEAMDSSGLAPSDVGCSQSTSVLSPTGNLATPHDTSPRFLGVDPNLANPLSIPVVKTGPLQTSSVETEVERCSPQQPGVGIPSSTHYMHTYVDPRQEVMNRTVLPSQMGFPNAQLFGTGRPVFTQQQFRDNASSVSTQFMPAVHMTMTPPSTLVGMRPTMLQPQQTRLDHYPDERTYGARVFQLPMYQNYNAYQSQVPSAMVGGGYVWSSQIRPPEHVVYSDGLVPHQVMIPEKIPRFEDCYMCQKALPHAHSDTLVQDQRDGVVSPVSDANLVYHSLRLEDNMGAWPMNRGMATRAMGEGIVDQGSAPLSRVLGQTDHQVGAPQQEAIGFSQNLDAQHENEGIIFQKPNNLDLPRTTAPQGLMNMAGDMQSPYGAFMGGIPQSFQDNAFQRPLMPIQYQVRQEALVNKPINSDVPSPIVVLPTQTSESLVHESPRAYPGKLPRAKEDAIEGRMETLQIRPTDILVTNEQSKSRIDELRKEDIINRPQQAAGREGLLDTAFSKPQMILDTNHSKPMEKPLPSHTEVPHVHNLLPVESFKVVEPPSIGNLGPCSPSRTVICHLDPVETRGNVVVSGVESTYGMDKIPPVSEWRDDTSSFQPKLVLGDVETFPLNSNMPSSSSSPSSRAGDAQDFSNSLFSNQDPWNMRQEKHFLPPRPNKIATNKETFYTPFGDNNLVNGGELLADMLLEDRAHQPSGNSDKDCNSDHVRSIKAEELIKQELQATAEGVAASVFQTATPSNSDLSAVTGNESASETNRDSGVSSSIDMQHTANVEGIKTKVPEKINIGFPVSDGLGRLQIIKNSDLEELQELGSGTFGTVYHGKWRGTDVAIKRINDRCFAGKPSEQERMRDDFWNEAIKLADLHHPNVVAFYGVVLDGPGGSVATVTEYMVNGSLRNALQRNERNLDKRKRLLIALDVAFGMEYLHGKNIVHFDLKSDNLLVNLRDPHRPICKVGDLGLSKVKCQTLISGGVRGTLPWMAPELLNGSSSLVSEKVDVFSFGIVLWELLTGEEPYADLHYGAIIGGIVSNTLRPPIPESCDPEWRLLMERCWASEPAERPNFTEIADELRSMAAKLPTKGQAQQQQVSSAQK